MCECVPRHTSSNRENGGTMTGHCNTGIKKVGAVE